MKIKADYVTNSSTTSFVVISDGEFDKKSLADLMGVAEGSPLEALVDKLYEAFQRNMQPVETLEGDEGTRDPHLTESFRGKVPDEVLKRVKSAATEGRRIWAGRLRSDWDMTELLFCCDSFEWENDRLYINGLECVW